MKAILAAIALSGLGAAANAATYSFEFFPRGGEWPFIAEAFGLAHYGAEFTIDVPSLKNVSIFSDATEEVFSPPIISMSLGMGPFDPSDASIYLETNRHGRIKGIGFVAGYASFFYFVISRNQIYGVYEDFASVPGYGPSPIQSVPGYWTINGEPAVVPIPPAAPLLLTGAVLLFGLRRTRVK